jgi:hypothetical protein
MRKAHLCDECVHFEPNREGVCLLGHRPYFYPPNDATIMNRQWGYKRRCQDYKPAGCCQSGQRTEAA